MDTVALTVDGERIAGVETYRDRGEDLPLLSPGFIDVHVHGGGGADTMDATREAFATIAQTHARGGTTGLLLTTVTGLPGDIEAVLSTVSTVMEDRPDGASVLGIHLEGPFLNPDRAGAQRRDLMVEPDAALADQWFASGTVRMITMAPERPGAHEVARMAAQRGILVAAGHTDAHATDMAAARQAGFSHVTHLCNAMRPLLHRDVGPIGHVIDDEDYTGDLICDGVHVAPAMLKALIRSIGTDRLLLITDAMRAAAMGDGTYDLGGSPVQVSGGVCRQADGALAGSVLTMVQAVRRAQAMTGISLAQAVQMASWNPAQRLRLPRKGRLEIGYDADIVCLDDGDEPLWTMVQGRLVHERVEGKGG